MTTVKQATGGTTIVTTPAEREIRTERIFHAPRERVWRALTEPELMKQWWCRGNPMVVETYEFRVGGHWRFVERAPEGDHGFEGRFREIAPVERLSMTFEWDGMPGHVSVETMLLEDLGDGRTRVIGLSLFHTQEDRDGMIQAGMEGGLNESYAALDRLLATMG
ncbi:MAG TPA: SRPBCC family protein [Gemmatimonadales bacterium]|nr:SRPBCC family protein [Gemmatimonadales bacterium]